MSGPTPFGAFAASEYEALEATLCESERGRWFLAEHARRSRAADTEMLLGAIAGLERAAMADRGPESIGHLRGNLVEMADAISRTRADVAAITLAPDREDARPAPASQALDAIVGEIERATSGIVASAEAMQEAVWALREGGVEGRACDALDRHATAIYTACSVQDLAARRTARIVYTLRYLEDRLSAAIATWDRGTPARKRDQGSPSSDEAAGPAEPGFDDLCQIDIDRYVAMEVPAVTAAAITARPGSPALHEDIVFVPVSGADDGEGAWPGFDALGPNGSRLGLDEIAAMPADERLALFG